MGALGVILLIAFVIICVLLVLVVLVQNEEGIGGVFGSRTSTAFGSHSASVLTKTTFVLVTLFIVMSFALALINKKPSAKRDLSAAAAELEQSAENAETQKEWWKDDAAAPSESLNSADAASGTEAPQL
ncbi:MAG: preprotein translocase subunit SecG [Treponema sp.]|nr:preprotein translocase subunit SecG [Treponema sp.]